MSSETTFTVRRLIDPTDEEINRTAEALASAFSEDDFVAIVTGGDVSVVAPFLKAQVIGGLDGGEVYVAEVSGGDIVGAAVWFKPGRDLLDTEAQKESMKAVMDSSSTDIELWKWWEIEFLPWAGDLTASTIGESSLEWWHLQVLGVVHKFHRKGIARALLQPVRDKAKTSGTRIFLEVSNPVNINKYQRLGFSVAGRKIYAGKDGMGSFEFHKMVSS